LAKLVVAAAAAAVTMALLGSAGGGRLGNFGDVGVDQATFAPAVFLWFAGIGALTVVMSGGIARRPRRPKAPEPELAPESEADAEDEIDDAVEEPEPEIEPEPQPEPEPLGSRTEVRRPRDPADVPDIDDPEEHFVVDDDATPDR
jgi:hypothetical protein